jgi:hypothetical protein
MSGEGGVCPCGGRVGNNVSIIKTLAGANKWSKIATREDLPVKIKVDRCGSCGRLGWMMKNNEGLIIDWGPSKESTQ